MKVTTKGQVTIPMEIREHLGIRPGSEVEFKVEGNVVRIIPVRGSKTRGRALIAKMRGRATANMSTDEIMKLTRGA